MKNNIEYGINVRAKLKSGIDKLADAVSVTLGPKGRTVILIKEGGMYNITKDGVSVAREVFLDDPIENVGAQMLKEVSLNTNELVGDGTTTATVLAQEILNVGFRLIEEGKEPIIVKRTLDNELKIVLDLLKDESIIFDGQYEDMYNIAKVSTNDDIELTKVIADLTFKSQGASIMIETSESNETYSTFIEGMNFKSTYVDSCFINDTENNSVEMKESFILFYNGKIHNVKDILNIIDDVASTGMSLMIMSHDIDQSSLLTLYRNTVSGKIQSVAVNAPGLAPSRREKMKDIALYSGGTIIEEGNLPTTKLDMLGRVHSITVKPDMTIIKGGKGDKEDIKKKVSELEKLVTREQGYNKEKTLERISNLQNGTGVLYIGASSELEYREKHDRAEDAIKSIKAALEEGIVPGGGTTLYSIANSLDNRMILKQCIKKPYQLISDSMEQKYWREDMLKQGIWDPIKVTRIALENAVSVAGTVLTTECAIVNK